MVDALHADFPLKTLFQKLKFEKNGWQFLKHGGNHDIYTSGNIKEQIVRHKEINDRLAEALIKKHGLK